MIGELLWGESTFMLDTDPGMPWWLVAGHAAGFREFMTRSLSVAATASYSVEAHDSSWKVRDHRSSDACPARQMT